MLLGVVAAAAVLLAIEPWPVGVFQDDGVYTILAKSLASGEGYRYLNIPGSPVATHYPPLYPAFLAGLWKLYPAFPQNVTLFKFANAALVGLAAALFYRLARRALHLEPLPAAAGVLAFTACTPVVVLSVMVLSEPLFLALLAPTLLVSERAAATGRPAHIAVAGALAVILAMTRTIGIVVVPAALLVLAWRRRLGAAALLCAVAVVGLLPWQLWVSLHADSVPPVLLGKYGSYAGWLTDAISREGTGFALDVVWANLGHLVAQGWATTATDGLAPVVRYAAATALAIFFSIGIWTMGSRAPVTALFVAGYLAIVVAWPFAPARFTWAIWPLLGLVFTSAVPTLWRWRPVAAQRRWSLPLARLVRGGALVALVLLGVGYGTYNARGASRRWWTVIQQGVADRARPLAAWVVASTDSTAVLATDDDTLLYLYTGRKAIPNGAFTAQEHLVAQAPAFSTASLRDILRSYDVDYVLASSDYGVAAVRGLLAASPPEIRVVAPLPFGGVFAPVARDGGNFP